MLLINFDFYDLYALITHIRANPHRTWYVPALEAIVGYLSAPQESKCVDTNTIRTLLAPIVPQENAEFQWVRVQNVYTAPKWIVKREGYYQILIAVFTELLAALQAHDTERAVYLADATHNVPCALVEDAKPVRRIDAEIERYRAQYHPDFLPRKMLREWA